jgi:hypothetical protein
MLLRPIPHPPVSPTRRGGGQSMTAAIHRRGHCRDGLGDSWARLVGALCPSPSCSPSHWSRRPLTRRCRMRQRVPRHGRPVMRRCGKLPAAAPGLRLVRRTPSCPPGPLARAAPCLRPGVLLRIAVSVTSAQAVPSNLRSHSASTLLRRHVRSRHACCRPHGGHTLPTTPSASGLYRQDTTVEEAGKSSRTLVRRKGAIPDGASKRCHRAAGLEAAGALHGRPSIAYGV